MTTSNEHNNAPAVPQGDTIEVIGIKPGKEHYLGTMAMPPRMKAREIAREQFGHFIDDDGSDAELCFGALEQLIDYMQKTAATPSPAPASWVNDFEEGKHYWLALRDGTVAHGSYEQNPQVFWTSVGVVPKKDVLSVQPFIPPAYPVNAATPAPAPADGRGNCFEGKSGMDHDCPKCGGAGIKPATPALPRANDTSVIADAQIKAGAAVIGDNNKPIGRNTAISVWEAMCEQQPAAPVHGASEIGRAMP